MGIQVIKQGIADSLQDLGRKGYQHLGINPGGVMDEVACRVAGMLVGTIAAVGLCLVSPNLTYPKAVKAAAHKASAS